ncbi:MAG: DUF3784 domain-containing protein [Peptostreptococcus porci]|nr:DUF3784 domain-containing protein [Peptostreptococcus porci]
MISIFCFIIALILLISSFIQYKTKNISLVSGYNKSNTENFSQELTNKICNTTAWVLASNGLSIFISAIFMLIDESSSEGLLFFSMIAYLIVTVLISLIFNNNHRKESDLSEKYYVNMYASNIVLYLVCILLSIIATNGYKNILDINIIGLGNIETLHLNRYVLISIIAFIVSIDSTIVNYIIAFKTRTECTIRKISIILLNVCIVSIICFLIL